MTLDERQRQELHSGDYVQLLDSIPISRMTRLVPAMALKATDRLVDFASGTGALAHLVCDRIQSYEGLDFASDFTEFARTKAAAKGLANATFHCVDIVDFCAAHADEYDVVTALDFSEHIYDEDFLKIFRGAHRILKPGGRLFIYTPNLDFFYERMKDSGLARQFPQHIAVRNDAQHQALLRQCGFAPENISVTYLSHFNVFRHLHPLRHLPLVGRYFNAKLFYRCVK